MNGNTGTWYGLSPDGKELMIDHGKLMEWAFPRELHITVGWSHAFVQGENRLVRGPKMIATARTQGWEDLAQKLEAFGFIDAVEESPKAAANKIDEVAP